MKNGKPLNKKIIAIAGAITIIVILIIAVVIGNNGDKTPSGNNPSDSTNSTNTENSQGSEFEEIGENAVLDTDGTLLHDFTDEVLVSIKDVSNCYDYVTIAVRENEMTFNENEEVIDSNYTKYIVSDIDMIKGKDCTVNCLILEEGEDPFSAPRLNFVETFGFNYLDYENVFDVLMKFAKVTGVGTDLENSTFNENLFEGTGQQTYVLNDENLPIIQDMLSQITYDEIVYTNCQFTVNYEEANEFDDGGYALSNISASVKYVKDGITKQKNIIYSFGLHGESLEW